MVLNINDILKTERFAAEAIYAVNGRTLAELVMRLEELQITIDSQKELILSLLGDLLEKSKDNPEEVKDIQQAIDEFNNYERYDT